MQRYTIFFIIVNALHVSGGFSAHHQGLKNCTHSIGLALELTHASGSNNQAWHIPDAVCILSCAGRKWNIRPAHDTATDTQWQPPEVVLTQFVSPDDKHDVFETCRELKI